MYAFRLNISEICMYSFARMCTINRLSRCYRVQSKLHIGLSYRILLLPKRCTIWLAPYMINVDITEIEVIDTSKVFACITQHTSLALLILRIGDHWKLSMRLVRADSLRHQSTAGKSPYNFTVVGEFRRTLSKWRYLRISFAQNDGIDISCGY